MLYRQLIKFGVIGCTAALINFLGVIALVETFALDPLISNVFAFIVAFQVSYVGHRYWTFNEKKHSHRSMAKFFIVASCSFVLNEGLYACLLKLVGLNYVIALSITLITVAVLTFIFSKFWAFR